MRGWLNIGLTVHAAGVRGGDPGLGGRTVVFTRHFQRASRRAIPGPGLNPILRAPTSARPSPSFGCIRNSGYSCESLTTVRSDTMPFVGFSTSAGGNRNNDWRSNPLRGGLAQVGAGP